MKRNMWLGVAALVIAVTIVQTHLIETVRNLRKERMPSMEDAEIVGVFLDGCGDGRTGAIKFKVGEDGARWVGYYFGDDPERPFAVVNLVTETVYLDLDRDGRIDEVRPTSNRGPCDDAPRVIRKTSKAGPINPGRAPRTVTM